MILMMLSTFSLEFGFYQGVLKLQLNGVFH
jgi:hypothetical protein